MNREDLLIASGFRFVPANTPERQAMFATLPPHKFLKEIKGDKVVYLYPDPTVCKCLYVGNEQAYANFRRAVFEKQLVDEQQIVANEMSMAQFNWNWAAWNYGLDPGWPYF